MYLKWLEGGTYNPEYVRSSRTTSTQSKELSMALRSKKPADYHETMNIQIGDVVLCRVHGSQFLHLVTATEGDRYRISNNHGHHNGVISKDAIYGRLIRLDP